LVVLGHNHLRILWPHLCVPDLGEAGRLLNFWKDKVTLHVENSAVWDFFAFYGFTFRHTAPIFIICWHHNYSLNEI
jgi:hypothetical protein